MSKLTNIKAAIIDLDGTMLDTAADFHVAVNRMRAELGLTPLSQETIVNFVGKGTENLIRRVLAVDYPEDEAAQYFQQALDAYTEHYLAINGDYSALYPGVLEGLQAMREKGLRLACVTNKPLAFAVPLLEKKGLSGFFEIVYGGDSFPRKKPDPMPLLQVCEDFALAPAQVVAIGDSSNDAQAARAAGCRVLNVPYGYNHGEPIHDVDSDGIVSTLVEAAQQISVD
ncbi:phosphoglycolate phosphatase [Herbaspirillum sp. AP02]|uniref:phosphoglycolate phosphatase n=1 Tax=unclassified Herbaspirillum TaxID=2624150 RepID=UPI0015D9759C|nr:MULTISPECIES: phosphoglycolate phosphatase [unclassified Herbaspirillum]MBG7622496.1 phosphoglycolate phosphatase [Herbaspirillum sp. AP02]NZD70134.1 phosphoglycolate phosphatase [Herbaspirillum sp. AP21]